jgi:hypothetical protein
MAGHRYKTTAAADHLGIPSYRLVNLLRYRRIPAPAKDTSGDYLWTAQDVERAREALAKIDARLQRGVRA